jgi:hypothetical protein
MSSAFDEAARAAVRFLSRDQIEMVAEWIAGDTSALTVLDEVPIPLYRQVICQLLMATNASPAEARAFAAERLRAYGEEYASEKSAHDVEAIWSAQFPNPPS